MPSDPTIALLDEIQAKAEAATPGERELWTGCSWRRIGLKYRQGDDPILEPTVARDGWPDLMFRNAADVELMVRCDPATILALVRVARAAQAIIDYETTGAPLFLKWDAKFEEVYDALTALAPHKKGTP